MNILADIVVWIKKYPIWAGVITLIIGINLYGLFSNTWSAAKIWNLERQIANEQKEKEESLVQRQKLVDAVNQSQGKVEQLNRELDQKNALLTISSEKVLATDKSLSTATDAYNRIMGDTSPMSKDELRNKLCELYNVPPAQCR
jgi:uncharacterized protein YlxW (UPF0749 family)